MSTRTTRSQAASASTSTSSPPPKPVTKVKGPSTSNKQANAHSEKENEKSASKLRAKAVKRSKKVYCTCRGFEDGRPMIECVECQDWFHFSCIDLSTRDAEDIAAYVCSSCTGKTGRHTASEFFSLVFSSRSILVLLRCYLEFIVAVLLNRCAACCECGSVREHQHECVFPCLLSWSLSIYVDTYGRTARNIAIEAQYSFLSS
ncbi:hypothetical protein BDZ89DRAFT_941849 [Hymenopellis radicata]|nr:hypothetical protein BDZ89DRAFT_941849 [Hymenopellis radicata]